MKHKNIITIPVQLIVVVFLIGTSNASELQFGFKNPTFGGNPGFSSHLFGLAGPQNQFRDEGEQLSPIEEFNDRLQRSLLGRITSAITSDIVDDDGNIIPGNFETIDYTINVVDLGNGSVSIETIDKLTGEKTVIELSSNSFADN